MLAVDHHPVKEEWRSVTTTSGALSVMTHGTVWMPAWLASILATAMKVSSTSLYVSITVSQLVHNVTQVHVLRCVKLVKFDISQFFCKSAVQRNARIGYECVLALH